MARELPQNLTALEEGARIRRSLRVDGTRSKMRDRPGRKAPAEQVRTIILSDFTNAASRALGGAHGDFGTAESGRLDAMR